MSKIRKAIRRNLYTTVLFAILLVLGIGMFAQAYRPTNSSTLSSAAEFRQVSRFAANYVHDKPFLWIPLVPMQALAAADLVSPGAGDPTFTEINSSESFAIHMDTDADSAATGLVPFPTDIDLAQDITCRVLWSAAEAAATGSVDYVLTYEVFDVAANGLAGTAISIANDAFDTDGGTQVDLGANVLTWGPYSTITGSTITATPGDDLFMISAVYDETTTATADIYGVQCRYSRKWLGGGND